MLLPGRRRFIAPVAALVLGLALRATAPADAQSSDDTGIIAITVIDATTKKPLQDARITLYGATQASALTNRSGIVKYTDVPSGIYRVRVVKNGFIGNVSPQFEMLGNKEVDVDVNLGAQVPAGAPPATSASTDASGLKVIGRVSARVSVTTRDVDTDSAVRKVSDSLTDALSKIAGVDVTQATNDPDAAQTISLNGHDESQTAVTLDGIPLGAPGTAVNLRGVNTDLFSGASVSFAAQAGSLGGAVNFRTLQPTQTWVTRLSTSYGTFDKFNYQLGETGSIGKLGIAVLHTERESNNQLTFNTFTDQSGLDYAHAGESSNVGDYLKLRYALGDKTIANFTVLQNNQGISSLCTQDVTIVPCGIRNRAIAHRRSHHESLGIRQLQQRRSERRRPLRRRRRQPAGEQHDVRRAWHRVPIDGQCRPLDLDAQRLDLRFAHHVQPDRQHQSVRRSVGHR
jgi:hypothetical protein